MIKYKTPVFYYVLFVLYILISLGILIFILYDYFTILNQNNLDIDDLVVTDTITTNNYEIFENSNIFNISGTSINSKKINIKNISSAGVLNSNEFFTSNIESDTLNSNFLIKDDPTLTNQVNCINYNRYQYDFIYGFLCFSYYGNNDSSYYKRLPTNFFSMYINQYPPAPSINVHNYFKFLDNSLSIKDFTFYDEIYKSELENDDYCLNKCYKSGSVSYSNSSEKYPYLELSNLGGFIENIKVYNTMFYNQDTGSNKTGVFPTNKYLTTKNFYGMRIPSAKDNLLRTRLDTRFYGQYASYNAVNFKIELNSQIINSDISSNIIYYDNICPRTIIYDDFYGDNVDPNKICNKLDYLKYTYNSPDQNMILTNSTELDSNCSNKTFSKSNIKYISLMTNSWYIVPSFIISFRINVVKNNNITFSGFNCPK